MYAIYISFGNADAEGILLRFVHILGGQGQYVCMYNYTVRVCERLDWFMFFCIFSTII